MSWSHAKWNVAEPNQVLMSPDEINRISVYTQAHEGEKTNAVISH